MVKEVVKQRALNSQKDRNYRLALLTRGGAVTPNPSLPERQGHITQSS